MAVLLSPYGGVGAQFLDNSGNVLTGGKIFTYAAGTTTPQVTFTNSTGNTPHSNPIILDASGRVPSGEIWLTDGLQYKFVLKDSNDVLIATYDNLVGINSNFVNFANEQEIQTATAGQTVFTLTTMAYQPATNSLSVFVDGVNQYGPGAQYAYIETDSTTVTFTNGLHVGAEVKFTTSNIVSSAGGDAFNVSYLPPFTGSVATNVGLKLAQTVSVKDFGAVGDGITDDTAAFNAAWAYIKNTYQLPYPNSGIVSAKIIIPAAIYRINSSINWTDLRAWNIQIEGEGAVLEAHCTNKAVIDCIGVRGLHLKGLTIQGDSLDTPSCAILVGPINTQTNGNNKFSEVITTGYFAKAAFANIGSETTVHDNCYWANNNTSLSAYAYIADGLNLFGFTSDYASIRAPGVAVSFTNNSHYSTHFRNYGGGSSTYLERTYGWLFDRGCYHLAFDSSNFVIRQTTNNRNTNLKIEGLWETTQGNGVKYAITFIIPEGNFTQINGFEANFAVPLCSSAVMRITNDTGGVLASGSFNLVNAKIMCLGFSGSTPVPLFEQATKLVISGELYADDARQLNLDGIAGFHGNIWTDNFTLATLPTGTQNSSYVVFDKDSLSGQVTRIGGPGGQFVGVQGGGSTPVLRAEGTNTDIDLRLQGKGAGLIRFGSIAASADAPVTGYIEIKDATGTIRKLAVIA